MTATSQLPRSPSGGPPLGLSMGSLSQGVLGAVHLKEPCRPERVLEPQGWGRKGRGLETPSLRSSARARELTLGKTTAHPRLRRTQNKGLKHRQGWQEGGSGKEAMSLRKLTVTPED